MWISEGARIAINPHQFEPLEKEETEKVKAFTGNKSASGRVPDPESFLIGRLKFVNHTNAGTQILTVGSRNGTQCHQRLPAPDRNIPENPIQSPVG